jgi:hypothetical protein
MLSSDQWLLYGEHMTQSRPTQVKFLQLGLLRNSPLFFWGY